jgi:hypothetical protein
LVAQQVTEAYNEKIEPVENKEQNLMGWFISTAEVTRCQCVKCSRRLLLLKARLSLLTLMGLMLLRLAPAMPSERQILSRHLPGSADSLQPIGRVAGNASLDLAIGLPLRNQQGLTNLLKQLYDQASPNYRKYLNPQQFTDKFGPSEDDYRKIIAFAKTNHLTVTRMHSNRTLLDVHGTVADIEKAFHVTLRQYQHPTENRIFYAPDVSPSLNTEVRLLAVSGLNDYLVPHPKNLFLSPPPRGKEAVPKGGSGPGGDYMGNDFRAAYAPGVSLNGAGQAVGLVEFEGYYLNDITNYEDMAGYTNVTLTNILVDGSTGIPDGDQIKVAEVSADIELAIAMAPGLSQVMVYEVSPESSSADDILNQMATDDVANQLSSSWDFATDENTEQSFLQFAAQGQSFFDACGDVGAYTGSIPNPDDDPYITIVGGTTLTTDNNGDWVSETTWNQGGGVAGSGGIIYTYSIPSWQQPVNMTANGGSTTMRNIPDVSLTANNVHVVYNNGSAGEFAGTSCAAPLWAGFMALVNQQAAQNGVPFAGFLNPALYWLGLGTNYAACFHDITTGNNTNGSSHNLFTAVAGYDLCTGWGTPSGSNLINALSTPEPLQILSNIAFSCSGLVGGPFVPSVTTITLTNVSWQPLIWALNDLPNWLTIIPTAGTLLPGSASTLSVGINTLANVLLTGTYTNMVEVLDVTDGFAQYCQFNLQALQTLVQNGSFETGNVSGWTESGNTQGIIVAKGTNYDHSGQYGVKLGPSGSLGYLSQTVPTLAGQAYVLSFWFDSPDGKSPNAFQVTWNGALLYNGVNIGATRWTNMQFMLQSAGASVLEFGFQDDPSFLGLDQISLTPVPLPNFQSAVELKGAISLSWNASTGLLYQVQYATNLSQGQWANLGAPVLSTNKTTTLSTPTGLNEARFYRVMVLP